jgi:hypothetical protein
MINTSRGEAAIRLNGRDLVLVLNIRAAAYLKTAFGEWEKGLDFASFDEERVSKFLLAVLWGNRVITDAAQEPEWKEAILDLPIHAFMPFVAALCSGLGERTEAATEGDGPLESGATR